MKKILERPEIEFTEFNSKDVITTSGDPMDGNGLNEATGFGSVNTFGGSIGQPLQ